MENFKKQYRDLEMRVYNELRNKIEKSNYTSKYLNAPAVEVDVPRLGYTELAIIDGRLNFLDLDGLHYFIDEQLTLEQLIDILIDL